MQAVVLLRRVGVASGRKVSAYLTRADYARFVSIADTADVPVAVLVRMALADAIPRWEAELAKDRTALCGPRKAER